MLQTLDDNDILMTIPTLMTYCRQYRQMGLPDQADGTGGGAERGQGALLRLQHGYLPMPTYGTTDQQCCSTTGGRQEGREGCVCVCVCVGGGGGVSSVRHDSSTAAIV